MAIVSKMSLRTAFKLPEAVGGNDVLAVDLFLFVRSAFACFAFLLNAIFFCSISMSPQIHWSE
jgi:hypothetical protein